MYFRYGLVMRREQRIGVSWGSYTQEFGKDSWIAVIAFVLLVPHVLLLVVRHSPTEYFTAVTFADTFIFTIGTITQQGGS